MEKLRVEIFIDADHKLGKRDYVQGKISGYADCICETFNDRRYGIHEHKAGTFIRTDCTIEEYVKLKTKIEHDYPGLCKLNIYEIVQD